MCKIKNRYFPVYRFTFASSNYRSIRNKQPKCKSTNRPSNKIIPSDLIQQLAKVFIKIYYLPTICLFIPTNIAIYALMNPHRKETFPHPNQNHKSNNTRTLTSPHQKLPGKPIEIPREICCAES